MTPTSCGWSEHQAALLRRRAANELDWDNVAAEIEDVAKRQRDRAYGALQTALVHLLKWQARPDQWSTAWRSAVVKARERIAKLTTDSPSLKSYPATTLTPAYAGARRIADTETGILDLPTCCPWTIEQVLDHGFWPVPLEG